MNRKKIDGKELKNKLSMESFKDIGVNPSNVSKPGSGVLILLISLFMISITLLVVGFLNSKSDEVATVTENKKTEFEKDTENVSDYFDEAFSKSIKSDAQDEVYFQDDPFKEICASTSGDDIPSITFGTVCYR